MGLKAKKAGSPKPAEKAPEPLIDFLRRGGGLTGGVCAQVRSMVAANDADGALALGLTLESDPTTADLGRLAAGIVAGLRGYQGLAWRNLSTIPVRARGTLGSRGARPCRPQPGADRGHIAPGDPGRLPVHRPACRVVVGDDRSGLRVR